MGIDDNRSRNPIQIAEQQIGGLSPDTGKAEKVFHIVRDLPAVLFEQGDGAVYQISGFGVVEAAGMNVFFNICK